MNPATMPRLFLNFDVNGTITLKDTSKKVSDDYLIISAIAENVCANWDSSTPSMSYKDYVYTILLPGDKSDQKLKAERQKVIGAFMGWLEEKRHPLRDQVKQDYETIKQRWTDATGKINFSIFPSFFVMIDKLREMKIHFTIILRTFGSDLPEVVSEIEAHPTALKFRNWGKFEGTKLSMQGKETVEKVEDVFNHFIEAQDHIAIVDDWARWNADQELGRSGKPFIQDSSGRFRGVKNLSMFFDDNITGEDKDIVQIQDVQGAAVEESLLDKRRFRVNTLEAMLDPDYFYNRILLALDSYDPF